MKYAASLKLQNTARKMRDRSAEKHLSSLRNARTDRSLRHPQTTMNASAAASSFCTVNLIAKAPCEADEGADQRS
jgi:hypothetical protein